jgi:hypothetical protein
MVNRSRVLAVLFTAVALSAAPLSAVSANTLAAGSVASSQLGLADGPPVVVPNVRSWCC